MLILIVANGPDKGRVFELTDDRPVTLGREGDPIRLHDRKVSRQHARLTCEGGAWTLEDLGSRHGTYRNRQKVAGSVPVRDGDVLQLGKSVLVASRLQVEQAERLALLGAVPTAAEAIAATRPVGVRWGRVTAAAAAVAVAVLGGLNVYHMQQTRAHTDQLARQLSDTALAQQRQDGELLAALQTLQAPADYQPMLEEILASAKAQQAQQAMLAELKAAVAALPEQQRPMIESILVRLDESPQAARLATLAAELQAQQEAMTPLVEQLTAALAQEQREGERLDAVLAAVEQRPTTAQIDQRLEARAAETAAQLQALASALPEVDPMREELAALGDRVAAQPTKTDAMIQRALAKLEAEAMANRLDAVLAALQQRPTLEQVDARLGALARANAQTAAGLEKLATAMPDNAPLQREMAAMRAMLQAQPTRLEELLSASLAKAGDSAVDLDKLHADIAAVKAALPADLSQRLDRVVAQLDLMPSTAKLAAAVEAAIEKPEAVGPVLAELREEIRQRPTGEQVAKELREVLAAQPDKVGPALAELSRRLESQPTAEQLASAVRGAVAAQGEKLAALAMKLDAMGQQADASRVLAAMQETRQEQDAALAAKLDALSARLETLATGVAGDAEQAAALAAAQDQTAKLLTDVLAAVQQTGPMDALREQVQALAATAGETDPVLAELAASLTQRQAVDQKLAALHDRLATWPTEAGGHLEQILAKLDAQEMQTTGALREMLAQLRHDEPAGADGPAPVTPSYASAGSARPVIQQVTPQPAAAADVAASTDGDRPLTPTEEAYRTAFLTGQPVRLGGGVDPQTGQAVPGRQLDPAPAKAAGIRTWREWYLIDGFAERMRLRRMAEDAREQRLTDDSIYRVERID